ncbi:MAG: Rpn family recombination-promoting nuclease/putative transposase [Eubacteriales bacterium]|nr:Rpn family recombination-promoting nuclease/putative transposase [Eubacteriales bacterium]
MNADHRNPKDFKQNKKAKSKGSKKKKLSQPHDIFFKENMGKKEVMADFLQSYLPEDIVVLLDCDSLVAIEPKHISPKLELSEADLLFQLTIQGLPCYVLVLMEHKSYQDRYTPLQMMQYMMEIWQHDLSEKRTFSPVLPIVFYQGAKKWEYPQIRDSLPKDMPIELLPFLPIYRTLFYDFSLESKLELKGRKLELLSYLQTIRTIYQQDRLIFEKETLEIFKVLHHFEEDIFLEYLEKTITYISATRQDVEDDTIIDLVKKTGGNTMETIIDRLERRGELRGRLAGRQQGILEGRIEGKLEGEKLEKLAIAREMKRDGFSIDKIMQYTKLSEEEILAL